MTRSSTRRELLKGIVGLSVATYVVAYALPIGLEEMTEVTGLEIEADSTHLIQGTTSESYTFVSWLGGGAQLAMDDGSSLGFKA